MGGGAIVLGAPPVGAPTWCEGQDVIDSLNGLFDQDPNSGQYRDAKNASLTLFQRAATSGDSSHLLAAYVAAYDAAGLSICRGWSLYLQALGDLGSSGSNGGNLNTTAATAANSAILTFGNGNVPDWMANGLSVTDSTHPGSIRSGQTVQDFDTATVTLTANVDAAVHLGDTIVFAVPAGLGPQDVRAIAQTRHDCLAANVRMTTAKHLPHQGNSGHAVKVSGGIIVTTAPTNTSSRILTFGTGNVPGWMEKDLNVYDNSNPAAITGGHKVHAFDNATVTLTNNVDATVNAGDIIVFSPPPLVGSVLIDSPYIPPAFALQSRRGFRQWLRRYLQSRL